MLRRLVVGLLLGLIVGGLAAAGLVAGLHVVEFVGTGGIALAYAAAAAVGVLTGLVAGKPIWAGGAKIEAGLKAVFGALLAAGMLFALRQWAGGMHVPQLNAYVPAGSIGDLPALALPIIAAVLGGFFELDNTGDGEDGAGGKAPPAGKRVAVSAANGDKKRVAGDVADDDAEEAAAAGTRAKR